jgi:DNA phosphorothioation-dependent restriction protein DptH
VHDRSAWGYAFNYWTFLKGDEYPDKICIHQVEVKLPVLKVDQADERTSQLVGQQILTLGPHGLPSFSVTFHVKPAPSRVQFLKKFVLQVISRERGPVGLTRSTAVWSTDRDYGTVSFSKLNKVEWEEGWHYVRVLAQTESGDPVPLVDLHDQPLAWTADEEALAALPNHSEPFYVLPDGDLDIDRDQRAVPQDPSLAHALVRIQFTVLNDKRDPAEVKATEVEWLQHKGRGRPPLNETIQVKFGREGRVHVPVARFLREIEQRILDAPDGPVNWRVQIDQGEVKPAAALTTDWPAGDLAATFLEARRSYFAALSQDPAGLISQGVDFRALRSQIAEYANAYAALVRDLLRRSETPDPIQAQAALSDLRKALSLDTVLLAIRDFRDRSRQAMLIAPTHPLRALWLTTWAELGRHWLEVARQAPQEYVASTRAALLDFLAPVAFPPVLAVSDGRLMTTVDNLHPFWTLYASADERDPRGLLGEVCAALALPEPAIGSALIDGDYLAARVQRYLAQHPYVSTLVINAFNVGRAAIVADTLRSLQKRLALAGLCYDIRLFVPDPDIPGVGEALIDLLNGDEDFAASRTGSQFRPKLAVSVRSLDEFRAAPERHTAHLTLLLDLFPAEQISVARSSTEVTAPVHGLVQNFQVHYQEDRQPGALAASADTRPGQAICGG